MSTINSVSQARLTEIPTLDPSSVAATLPTVRALQLAGLTPMAPMGDFSSYLQSVMLDVNALIQAGQLTSGETIYSDTYGSSSPHSPGTPSAPPSREQGADLTKINQLAYHSQLGTGSSTMSRSGCLLSSLTMSANDMRRANGDNNLLNLSQANDIVRDHGGFSGSDMKFNDAAHALGVNVQSRQVASDATVEGAKAQMQQRPNSTRLIVGVDYKAGANSAISSADHYIAVKGVDDHGNLLATDPVGGKDITFTKGFDGKYRSGKYTVAEVSVITQKDPSLGRVAVPTKA